MNSLSEDCARLARVLADRNRKHELHVFGDTVTINGAHFDTGRFYEIVRRAASLANHAREFSETESPALAATIRGHAARLEAAPILPYKAGPNGRAGFIDLAEVRKIEFRAMRAGKADVRYETVNGAKRHIDVTFDEMIRMAQDLERRIEATPVVLAYSKAEKFGARRIFVNTDHIVQAFSSFGDVLVSWSDNDQETIWFVSDEKVDDHLADAVVERILEKRLALRKSR